jgi:sarcosine oxidase subunit alpha
MELDGRTTPDDLGLGKLVSTHKDFIGKRSLALPALAASHRKQLVGLTPLDGRTPIPRGAQLVVDPSAPMPNPIVGHVTATCHSLTLGHPIALALLRNGRALIGQSFHATSPLTGKNVAVKVTANVFVDAEGARLRG